MPTLLAPEQDKPLDLGLTITPEPSMEAEPPPALQQTAAPAKHPQATLPHPEPVQGQQPALTEVPVQPLDLEATIT